MSFGHQPEHRHWAAQAAETARIREETEDWQDKISEPLAALFEAAFNVHEHNETTDELAGTFESFFESFDCWPSHDVDSDYLTCPHALKVYSLHLQAESAWKAKREQAA